MIDSKQVVMHISGSREAVLANDIPAEMQQHSAFTKIILGQVVKVSQLVYDATLMTSSKNTV